MITASSLSFRYPRSVSLALEDIGFEIARGEAVGLAGSSGAGKTTLMKLLSGVAPRSTGGEASGRAVIAGRELPLIEEDLADAVGCVPQDPHAGTVCDRVLDEVVFTAENLGHSSSRIDARLATVAEMCGISHLFDRRLAHLSGGERQRVQIASALVAAPQVLLLDEPTSQLDPDGVASIEALLRSLRDERELTMLVSEHRLERLERVLDRRIELGEIVEPALPALSASVPGEVCARIEGLSVELAGRTVLSDLDLDVRTGEAVALLGPNGSGKTTLMRAILGSLPTASGRLRRSDRVAWVPQRPEAAFFKPTVREEVVATLDARRCKQDPDQILSDCGLAGFADRSPRDLSSGERLRVALCALTVGEPELILLDEPTRGLDRSGRVILLEAIGRWMGEDRAVLLATHDRELAAACSRRVGLLNGRLEREEVAA